MVRYNKAILLGTNGDVIYPVGKKVVPGAGTILAAVQTCTQTKPVIVGKPNPFALKYLMGKYKIPKKQFFGIGDLLATDILFAQNAGIDSGLVLTGLTSLQDVKDQTLVKHPILPMFIFKNLQMK